MDEGRRGIEGVARQEAVLGQYLAIDHIDPVEEKNMSKAYEFKSLSIARALGGSKSQAQGRSQEIDGDFMITWSSAFPNASVSHEKMRIQCHGVM